MQSFDYWNYLVISLYADDIFLLETSGDDKVSVKDEKIARKI